MDYVKGGAALQSYYERTGITGRTPPIIEGTIFMRATDGRKVQLPVLYRQPRPNMNVQFIMDLVHKHNPVRNSLQFLRVKGFINEGYSQLTDTYDVTLDLGLIRFTRVKHKFEN